MGTEGTGRAAGGAFECSANRRPQTLFLAITIVAIAVLLLATFTALLRFHGQRGDRTGFEPLDADLLAGLDAVSVAAILDALDRFFDLADQFALTVARA